MPDLRTPALCLFSSFALLTAPLAQDAPAPAGAPPSKAAAPSLLEGRAARRDACKNPNVLQAVRAGVGWLSAHQDADGRWDCDKFMKHDPPADACTGPGAGQHDVGATALALLAILAQGDTVLAEAIHKGAYWLAKSIGKDGRVDNASSDFIYGQAIATLALTEASVLLNDTTYRAAAESALRYLAQHRHPAHGWRYEAGKPEADTSVTSWCMAALAEAAYAGFSVPPADSGGALAWLDQVTDPTGSCGYLNRGEPSSRPVGSWQRFPAARGEAGTAAGLHARLISGLVPESALARAAANTIVAKLPTWDEGGGDTYYWFHGSMCMAMMAGTAAARKWDAALQKALLSTQRKEKSAAGSWDPNDVWGEAGGRVVTTAFAVLALSSWRLERIDAESLLANTPGSGPLVESLRADRLGEAHGLLGRMSEKPLAPDVAAAVARVRWQLDVETAHAERQLEAIALVEPDAAGRAELLEKMQSRFAGTAVGDKAAQLLKRLRDDPATKREAAAAKELQPLQKAYDALRAKPNTSRRRDLRDDLTRFIAKHAGTEAAKKAQALLASL
ncbi:MAG TPA: hypothetical protein VFD82_20520 [Planctomycetota bacterium]|nr:hypothetical protein [Planctomycetota bacterium]